MEEEVEVTEIEILSVLYSNKLVCVSLVKVEYEVEEMQLKEVEKEITTEVMMPRVKSLYRYKGQGMGFEKGEVSRSPKWLR